MPSAEAPGPTEELDNNARLPRPGAHPPEPLQRIVAPGDWSVFAVSWHPQGRQIAVATEGSRVRVYDLSGEEVRERLAIKAAGLSGLVHGVALSPDGTRLATASHDKVARVWDVASGTKLLEVCHDRAVWAVAFSGMAPVVRPAARTSAPVCGMRPAARGCLRSVTTAPCGRWRSAQMALAWLLAASTGAFRYGRSRQTQSYELVLTFSGRPPGWRVLSNRKASRLSVLTMVASNAASACGCSIGWAECTQTNACAFWLRRGVGLRRGSCATAAASARSAATHWCHSRECHERLPPSPALSRSMAG